ncbi:uncharacterized protein EI90DRAFT_199095 [Cantharellus anzutake]|uniref:uncharacterized protein n=1 Tax=Cantharellus anzutake TaxID=1750568 RepID=UPI00190652CC|nr:uncharacterized protein EI90DRAFT_199095 [Cantharellus anzutake]KAF8336619.1 hypothetical protein EI90DRAFT_199095 [Cantharellus anzutake]
MGAIPIAQRPLSVSAWDVIPSPLLKSSIQCMSAELAPLISGVESDKPIRIVHRSFRDFLVDRIDPQSPTQDLFTVKDLELTEGLFFKFSSIPHEALSEHVHYACRHPVYHLTQVRKPLEAPNRSVGIFLNEQIVYWVEVCVRTEGYISISSFPEWAKLSVDWTAKDVIHILVEVFSNVSGDLGFFSRLQEACLFLYHSTISGSIPGRSQ